MKIKILLTIAFILSSFHMAFAEPGIKDFKIFKNIPVLDQGRLKPIDTFARSLLTQFSGKDHYEKQDASSWLASLFFNPDSTVNDKIFQINNPDTATALGITPDQHRRYTPAQLQKAYPKLVELQDAARKIPEKERNLVENEILRVFENINIYADLSRSFLFTSPQKDLTITSKALKTKMGLPLEQNEFSFIDIALKADVMTEMAQSLEKKSQSQFTADELEIYNVTNNLFGMSQKYKEMPSFTVLPSATEKGRWLNPWDALILDFSNQQTRQLLSYWNTMAISFRQDNGVEFNVAAHLYMNQIKDALSNDELKSFNKFPLELFYHSASPFTLSIMFYILTFIFFIISFSSSKQIWYTLAMWSTFAGFAIHTIGLLMRIIIMARPPVSSLYETFIFVGFITVLLGLIIEHFNRQWLGFVTAAISGTALLFIANKYSAEGDTLKMLVAVLNSNFWLATHVTTITMGYAATWVGGVLGHIWLLQAVFGKDNETLDKTYKTTLGILGVALTLTFLGTNLGGIWADQSWGRFWGWDPKENGALMIVLWTALLFHAKVAKMIGPLGMAVGAVFGMMVVMWAWFGVNLLSVGLHSYGFTAGIATTLIAYAVIEIVFMMVTIWFISRK
ncbi:MAG: cytochrome c biogenesis protein CcsA [Candidatus Omnitrophica bacterium]|nr:cytochrome c biogenesis protein CcsA [Candidatus Omnitrophota bacterium]